MNQQLPEERARNIAGIYGSIKQIANIPSAAQLASATLAITGAVTSRAIVPYRPVQWADAGQQVSSSTVYMRTYLSTQLENENGEQSVENYFFDAVLAEDHSLRRQITEHPVQWQAALSDHSYQLPSVVTLEVGMSDVMDSFLPSIYLNNNKSKSVNAFQTFVALEKAGQPVTLQTKLMTYKNMVIESISAHEDNKTTYGARFSITFREVFIGKTGTVSKSLYPAASTGTSTAKKDASVDVKVPQRSIPAAIFKYGGDMSGTGLGF